MKIMVAVVLALVVLSAGADLLRSKLVYGNYRCAYASCRIVYINKTTR